MSKKDYVAIAAAFRKELNAGQNVPVENLAHRLAAIFAGGNKAFDPEKFLQACGLEG